MAVIDDRHAWKGNDNLRKADWEVKYTLQQLEEIEKCSEDPIYFIRTYCKIVNLNEGLVNFLLYDYQEKFVDLIHSNTRIIAKWARQSGKTITTAAYICWYVIFNEHQKVGILAHQQDGAQEILERIQLIYENLPIWLQAGITSWNKRSITLDNGCGIITAPTKSTRIRGKSISLLYLDEIAFISDNDFDAFFKSVLPTIASAKNAKIIMSSTPDGMNHFYRLWTEAVEGVSEYKHSEIKWSDPPGRDEEFKKKTIAEIGYDRWMQEYECAFLGASGALIDAEVLEKIPCMKPIEELFDKKFRIYERPVPEGIYVVIGDVGEGLGQDSSTVQVLRIDKLPFDQVAVYQDNTIKTNLFHMSIHKIAVMYNNALAIIENNSVGTEVNNNLYYESEYENMFYNEDKHGLKMTKVTKRIGAAEMKFQIEQFKLKIRDFNTLSELSTFIRKPNGGCEAKSGKTDDLVTPLILFCYFVQKKDLFELWFEEIKTDEINTFMINKIDNELLPIGWHNDGHGYTELDDVEPDDKIVYSTH